MDVWIHQWLSCKSVWWYEYKCIMSMWWNDEICRKAQLQRCLCSSAFQHHLVADSRRYTCIMLSLLVSPYCMECQQGQKTAVKQKLFLFLFHHEIAKNAVKQKHLFLFHHEIAENAVKHKLFCFCFNAKLLTM